ncbi:transposase [Pseudovibrio denitrificans]|uniref:transposase n=1 Tax=Pseudovibrio denitrificans TaxID=258256 RepID=UPI0039BF76FC
MPPPLFVSQVIQKVNVHSSYKTMQCFTRLKKVYWGCHFWAGGYFCTTSWGQLENHTSVNSTARGQTFRRKPVVV